MVTNKAVFIFNSFKKTTSEELSLFELELVKQLAVSCDAGQERWAIPIGGIVERRAAYLLVRRKLAAFVKSNLYPSHHFLTEFHPSLEGEKSEEAITGQYLIFSQE